MACSVVVYLCGVFSLLLVNHSIICSLFVWRFSLLLVHHSLIRSLFLCGWFSLMLVNHSLICSLFMRLGSDCWSIIHLFVVYFCVACAVYCSSIIHLFVDYLCGWFRLLLVNHSSEFIDLHKKIKWQGMLVQPI